MSWVMTTEMGEMDSHRELRVYIGEIQIASILLVHDHELGWAWRLWTANKSGQPDTYKKLSDTMKEMHRRLREPRTEFTGS